MKTIADHIRTNKCAQIATSKVVSLNNAQVPVEEDPNEMLFSGRFINNPGNTIIQGLTQLIKPIVLLAPSICRAFIWLQIERRANGQWQFTAWSLLSEDALKDVTVTFSLVSPSKRAFSCRFNVMSALELAKHEAVNRGECEIKYDEQLRVATDFHELAFDFMVSVQTTSEFREALNHDNFEDVDLNKYIMDTLRHGTNGLFENQVSHNAADVAVDLHIPANIIINDFLVDAIEVQVLPPARGRPSTPETMMSDEEEEVISVLAMA